MARKDRELPPFPGAPPPIPEDDGEGDPLVGRELDGRFRIGPRIAVGAMGKIFTAVQEPLGRLVALKVLSPSYAGELDPEFERRFYLEASAASGLKHPNTITVHDYGLTEDGLYYIVMELVEGQTLAQLVRSEGPLEILRALDIVSKVARSLREAHHRGVVHRDLKPENIMITEFEGDRDWVKVLDFGLVKLFRPGEGKTVDDLTNPNLVMGSPRYMSPEQARNKGIEPRSDVYSLGIVLFLLLTGTVPFGRDPKTAAIDIIDAHLNKEAPRLSEVARNGDFPGELEDLVARCLAKSPEDRPADMDELLDGLLGVEQTLRRGGHGVARTMSETGGGRWIGALLALATLVLLGAFGLLGYMILGDRIEEAVDPSSRVLLPITPARPAMERFMPVGGDEPRELLVPALDADGAADRQPEPADPGGEVDRRQQAAARTGDKGYEETTYIVTSQPPGAEVYEAGQLLGLTPLTLNRERSRKAKHTHFEVTLWLAGHEPSRLSSRGSGPDVDPLLLHADLVKLDSPEISIGPGAAAAEDGRVEPGPSADDADRNNPAVEEAGEAKPPGTGAGPEPGSDEVKGSGPGPGDQKHGPALDGSPSAG